MPRTRRYCLLRECVRISKCCLQGISGGPERKQGGPKLKSVQRTDVAAETWGDIEPRVFGHDYKTLVGLSCAAARAGSVQVLWIMVGQCREWLNQQKCHSGTKICKAAHIGILKRTWQIFRKYRTQLHKNRYRIQLPASGAGTQQSGRKQNWVDKKPTRNSQVLPFWTQRTGIYTGFKCFREVAP